MRLGLQVSYFSWPEAPHSIGPTFGRIARNAEAEEHLGRLYGAGVDTVIIGMGDTTDDAAYESVAELVRQVGPMVSPPRSGA